MKKKEFKRIDAQPLVALMKTLGFSQAEMGDLIGVSGSTISGWLSSGEMPAYMEHVVAQLSAPKATTTEAVLVSGQGDKMTTLRTVAEGFGLTVSTIQLPAA